MPTPTPAPEADAPLAILTSGGDAPGMNMAVWAACAEADRRGRSMIGVHDGFAGLLERRVVETDEDEVVRLMMGGGRAEAGAGA